MILGERFYQMSNAIFCCDLTPAEFMVYSYLVSCAGQKDVCWPSVGKIAVSCNCSENTVRKAIDALVKKRFSADEPLQSTRSLRRGSSAEWRRMRTGKTVTADRRTTPTTSSTSRR